MLYVCKGELHKDFHASILDGVNYHLDDHGEEAARRGDFTQDEYRRNGRKGVHDAKRGPDLVRTNLDDIPPFLTGRIADSRRFEFFHPNLRTAFEFLRKTDLKTLKQGRNEVDGDNVYVNVMMLELEPFDKEGEGEAHRTYMDIHVPISGTETIGTYTMTGKELALPFNEKDDYVLFKAKGEPLEVMPGEFVMFFPPHGGHRPGCTQEKSPPKGYVKAVVKVKMK